MKTKRISFQEDRKRTKKRKTFQVFVSPGAAPVSVDLTGIKAKHIQVFVCDPVRSEAYPELAKEMADAVYGIRCPNRPTSEKLLLAKLLRRDLLYCLTDPNLKELTKIYRKDPASNLLGYDAISVAAFVGRFLLAYPGDGSETDSETAEEQLKNLNLPMGASEQKEEKD